ncbi:MAG: HU family DNA-binding protein [Oscillospiraceae bacterium]|jgi:DNA-binding protein HU-beta|nr:HU family DNA-binding protein [Oscillospiraceae bacterium]
MNRADLISAVAKDTGLTKVAAEAAIVSIFGNITDSLKKGEKFVWTGFGSFEVRQRAARIGINPQTQEKIKIKASKVPAFKAGKALKEAVANPKAKKAPAKKAAPVKKAPAKKK